MRKRVQQYIPGGEIFAAYITMFQPVPHGLILIFKSIFPLFQCIFSYLDKQAFSQHFYGGKPIQLYIAKWDAISRQMVSFESVIISIGLLWRNTTEASQRKDLAQALCQYDILDIVFKEFRDCRPYNSELHIFRIVVITHTENTILIFKQVLLGILTSIAVIITFLNLRYQLVNCTSLHCQ